LRPFAKKIVFIVGPTGAGKTQVGLSLSRFLPCAYICADSMQIYKGMDVVTDKIPKALRRKYPHHMLDIIAPTREFNVADFCKFAAKAVAQSIEKKKMPVVIGGTGLYIHSLLYGIFEGGSKDEKVREDLRSWAQKDGVAPLYERLKEIDPQAAAKINANDAKRIIRALEVYTVTKQPISVLQARKSKKGLAQDYKVYLFGLRRERVDLYNRIDQRVDFMVHAGLLDEVRHLLKKKLSKTAYFCIGIREIEGFLKGRYRLDEAVRLIKRNSRHYAKRQMTWFGRNPDIAWIDVAADENMDHVAEIIYKKIEDKG
jgi:tRNA dimethylallyltransferase